MNPTRGVGAALVAASLAHLAPAEAANLDGSGVSPEVLSLPKGPGSIEGLGAAFQPQLATGTGSYAVSFDLPSGPAGFRPKLGLVYSTGHGNGIAGVGWDLDVPRIQRRTDEGIPLYAGHDVLLSTDGEELVAQADNSFRTSIERNFARYWFYTKGDWGVEQKDGRKLRFGQTAAARVADGNRIFAWVVDEEKDVSGNRARYVWQRDGSNTYLVSCHWAEGPNGTGHAVYFDYEARPDVLTDYRSSFAVTTKQRLARVRVTTNGAAVRSYQLTYEARPVSVLTSVSRFDRSGTLVYPAVERFAYTAFAPNASAPRAIAGAPAVALGGNTQLADLDGDGLPDVLQTTPSGHFWRRNLGSGTFGPEATFSAVTDTLATGAQLADVNGDGFVDLLVQPAGAFSEARWYPNLGNGSWELPRVLAGDAIASAFSSPSLRFVDVDFDKRTDVVISTGSGFLTWRNVDADHWTNQPTERLPEPGAQFGSDAAVQLADMNGDRLLDLVQLRSGGVRFHPQKGRMTFDAAVEMSGVPNLDPAAGSLRLLDVNGDGLADLVLVAQGSVELRLNEAGTRFSAPLRVTVPSFDFGSTSVQFADVNGNGSVDVIWSSPQGWQFLDLSSAGPPNILVEIDNSIGRKVSLAYASSAALAAAAGRAGQPWSTRVPMPMQVLSELRVTDAASGVAQTTRWTYRDGYYDGVRKQFRGFANVVETKLGGVTTPSLVVDSRFDVGLSAEARKGLLLSAESRTTQGFVFQRRTTAYETRLLPGAGTAAFATQHDTQIVEGTGSGVTLRDLLTYDDYGNVLVEKKLGSLAMAGDERETRKTYALSVASWILDRVAKEEVLDGARTVSATYTYYDGLAFGQVTRGLLSRRQGCLDGATESSCPIALERREHDTFGNVIAKVDAEGGRREWTFDSSLNAYPVTERVAVGNGAFVTTGAEYDLGLGKMTRHVDPNGQVTRVAYDGFGRMVAISEPGDPDDAPTQTFEYVLASPVSRIISRRRQSDTAVETRVTCIDGLGRNLAERVSVEGGRFLVTKATAFDERGSDARTLNPFFAEGAECSAAPIALGSTSRAFDALGRVTTTTNPDGTTVRDAHAPLAVTTRDEKDIPKTVLRDGLDRTVAIVEPNGVTTRYEYDARDLRTAAVDPGGQRTTWTYDGLSRVVAVHHPDAGRIAYAYDRAGRLVETTDARGQKVRRAYDLAGRPVSKTYGPGSSEEYHYDDGSALAKGRIDRIRDLTGEKRFTYDPRGRIASVTRALGGRSYTESFEYDRAGHEVSRTYPDGTVVTRTYDLRGELASIPGYLESREVNEFGQTSRERTANGVATESAFDVRGRVQRTSTGAPAGPGLQDLTYARDPVGNITAVTDPTEAWTYHYDDLHRLIRAESTAGIYAYSYDAAGRIQQIDGAEGHAFTYGTRHAPEVIDGRPLNVDASGNWLTYGDRSLEWDAESRLARVLDGAGGELATYTYDANGVRTKKVSKDGTTLWVFPDYEVRKDRAVRYVLVGSRRLARSEQVLSGGPNDVAPVGAVDRIVDAADAVVVYNDGRANENDVRAVLRQAVEREPDKTSFAVTDHLGGTTVETDESGARLSARRYAPYGSERAVEGPRSEYGYSTKELDAESGLMHFGAREYASSLGLWMSVDPVTLDAKGKPDPRNGPYVFALSNPIGFIDPDGRDPLPTGLPQHSPHDSSGGFRNSVAAAQTLFEGAKDTRTAFGVLAGASLPAEAGLVSIGALLFTVEDAILSGARGFLKMHEGALRLAGATKAADDFGRAAAGIPTMVGLHAQIGAAAMSGSSKTAQSAAHIGRVAGEFVAKESMTAHELMKAEPTTTAEQFRAVYEVGKPVYDLYKDLTAPQANETAKAGMP